MSSLRHLVPALALAALSGSSFATSTVYTSASEFLSLLTATRYTESFDGLGNGPSGPQTFGSGAFEFTASATSDLYLLGGFLGTSQIDETLTVNLGTGIKAVGANFFAVDYIDAFQAVQVTLNLSDGTTTSFTPSSLANSYRGFVSTVDIRSFTISGPGASLYASLDNLTLGNPAASPVPEPSILSLMSLAALAGFAIRRRAV